MIRGTNWIGDAILTLPAVFSIRATYPQAHIAVLVKPWVADIYELFSVVDEIIIYENKFDTPAGVFRLARMLKRKNFDAAILLQNAIEAAIIVLAAGIPLRAGYDSDARGLLLDVEHEPDVGAGTFRAVEQAAQPGPGRRWGGDRAGLMLP